jgi:hypothetical protein
MSEPRNRRAPTPPLPTPAPGTSNRPERFCPAYRFLRTGPPCWPRSAAGHIDQALEVGKGLVAGTPLYALQVAVVSGLLDADRVSRALAVIEEIPNAGIREAARLKTLAFLLEARRDTQADELAATFDDGMDDPKVKIAYSRALARRGDFGAAIAMIEGPSTTPSRASRSHSKT